MPWKIAAELLFFSPFLFLAFALGVAEAVRIIAEIRNERIDPARAPQVAVGSIYEVRITRIPPVPYEQ